MTTHFADDKTLAELARLERELAEAEKQINVLIAGLTEQTVRADEARQYAEELAKQLRYWLPEGADILAEEYERHQETLALLARTVEGVDKHG